MRLFLQIDIGDWKQRNYNNPLVPYASSLAADLMGTDIDNQSESTVIDLVIKLSEQAETLLVFIAVDSESPVGSIDKMIRYLVEKENKVHQIVMLGEHSEIKKLTKFFQERFCKAGDIETVKKLISNFAKKAA